MLSGLSRRWRWYRKKLELRAFRLARQSEKFVDRDGVRLLVRSDAISDQMFWQLHRGDYEGAERTLLTRHLEPGDRVLEIGAGIGYLALVALKKGASRHVAVEANPDLLPLIDANLRENGADPNSYRVIQGIVSDAGRKVTFSRTKDFWESHIESGDGGDHDALSTSELLRRCDPEPNFLIMDIEGGEKSIQFENFRVCRKLMIELHPEFIGHEGCCTVLRSIMSLGFELRDYRGATFYFDKTMAHVDK